MVPGVTARPKVKSEIYTQHAGVQSTVDTISYRNINLKDTMLPIVIVLLE